MLKDKVIVVIGGNGLLGASFTKAITKNNGIPIVASRKLSKDVFKSMDDLSSDQQQRIDYATVDITSVSSVDDLFSSMISKYGRIDAVVNSSFPKNQNFGAKFEDVAYKDFCENIGTHLGGCFLVCQKATAHFVEQGYGNIVNISSVYGLMAPRFEIYEGSSMTKEVEYIVSKSAIIHLTKYLAKYLKGKNIRVNCLSPGGILDGQPQEFVEKYNFHSLSKGMLSSEDINGALLFLLSDQSKFINGQNIVVDDGFSL